MTTSLPEKPHGGTGWRNRHQNPPHPLATGVDVGVKEDLFVLYILLVTDTPPRSDDGTQWNPNILWLLFDYNSIHGKIAG